MLKSKIRNKNKNLGITLIALVVAVIVLIILAGVSINLVLGENGIFKLAYKARENYTNAEQRELTDIEKLYSSMQIATNDDSQITISISDLRTIIKNEIKNSYKSEELDTDLEAIIDARIKNTVESKDAIVSSVPAGTVISYIAGSTPPAGYLACDGTEYNISEYPNLAKAFKEGFGNSNKFGGNGTTTFKVPNLQGEFLRGSGQNSHENQGNGKNVGIHQNGTEFNVISPDNDSRLYFYSGSSTSVGGENSYPRDSEWANIETIKKYYIEGTSIVTGMVYNKYTARPTNTSVLYCIKY